MREVAALEYAVDALETILNFHIADRLLDLRHRSTVTQLDQALRACGQRYEVAMREAEAA